MKYSTVLVLMIFSALQGFCQKKNIEAKGGGLSCNGYTGEYQWFIPEGQLKWFDKIFEYNLSLNQYTKSGPWGTDFSLSYKIEAVGFPFIPKHDLSNPAVRQLKLPEMSSYIDDVNNLNFNQNIGFGVINFNGSSAWRDFDNYDNDQFLFRSFREEIKDEAGMLNPYILCDVNGNEFVSINRYSSLISDYFNSSSLGDPDIYRWDARIYYPHTALKHTIFLHCGSPGTSLKENIIDSISFVIDHTWINNKFPWYNQNYNDASTAALHDFELISFMFESIPYSDNGSSLYSGGNGELFFDFPVNYSNVEKILDYIDIDHSIENNTGNFSTIDFFTFLSSQYDCQGTKSEPVQNYYAQPNGTFNFDPYNYYRTAPNSLHLYSGSFNISKNPHASGGIVHEYKIDKPIDLTLINPYEKVIYNPSSVSVDLNGIIILPSGYKFKTSPHIDYGTQYDFPTSQAVSDDKLIMESFYPKKYKELKDVPVRANQIAEYRIKAGSSLLIEDCVEMFDAEITVESGAVLEYNSETFIFRNVTITNQGGTVIDRAPTATCFEKNNNDCRFHYPDGVNITQNTTWNGENLYIRGKVSITNGAELTINNSTLRFADTDEIGSFSGIDVGAGSKLIVNSSTLDAVDFCPAKWSGIIARGPNMASPGDPHGRLASSGGGAGGSGSPSTVEISNSNILNAYTAIWAVTNSSLIGGAKLDIFETDFQFNLVDIKIDNDIHQISTSVIDACVFSSNDWFKAPYTKTANIEVTGIDGVRIKNSEFVNGSLNNNSTYSPVVGIQISESELAINGNSFSGLEKGLEINNGEKNIVISSNTFTRNRQNLLVNTAGNLEIRNNTSNLNPNSQAVFNNFFNTSSVLILSASEIDIRKSHG